ncbi:TPA: amino acid adenylation domain-containing protein [Providencia alcalifaciens]
MSDLSNKAFIASPYTRLFWNEYLLNPNSSEYNLIIDQDITGNIDINKLEKAIILLSKQYPLLSMNLKEDNYELLWILSENIPKIRIINNIDELEMVVNTPFNLECDCLVRYYLLKKGNDSYRFLAVLHHVVIDGTSAQEFYDALSHAYNSDENSTASIENEEKLKKTFLNYHKLVDNLINKHESIIFWQDTLKQCPSKLDLPFIKNSKYDEFDCDEIRFNLNHQQWLKLKEGIKYANHFLVFKTIWTYLIGRYTGQKTVFINYPISIGSGKSLSFGAQVNTAIFPLNLSDEKSFLDYYSDAIKYTRSLKLTGNLRHSLLPIYEVLSASSVKEMDVSFSQAYLKDNPLNFSECNTKINSQFNNDMAGSALILEYQKKNNDFSFRIRYKKCLFHAQQMEEMALQFQHLIEVISSDPSISLSNIPLLTPNQQDIIVQQYQVNDHKNETLISLFDKMAAQYPNQPALSFDNITLTYEQLQKQTNYLASCIKKRYNKISGNVDCHQVLIPFIHNRGINAIISMIAIMRTGATYVPLDPQMPKERIKLIIEDINGSIILTDESLIPIINDINSDLICLLIDSSKESNTNSCYQPIDEATSDTIAYAIYTSGTTGKPKGTLIPHRGPVGMLDSVKKNLKFSRDQYINILQFSSFVFDAHVLEVYIALTSGCHLFIADDSHRKDLPLLQQKIAEWNINFSILPPALLSFKPIFHNSLHTLCVGGEAVSQNIVDFYRDIDITLINMYGPTEASVLVTMNKYFQGGARNLGKALSECQLLVTDENLNIQPLGVIGELCISGPMLANGYLNQLEQTKEKFVQNPYSTNPCYQYLYHTGDLVRRLVDGSFEYLGRNDHQIKIHGHRIELDEIEKTLLSHPDITDAKIAVRFQSGPIICCWYITNKPDIETLQIQEYVARILPHYMVPTAFMKVDGFPLNVSGKIDLKSLPTPDSIQNKTVWRGAQTPLEQKVLSILCSILSNKKLGIDDHFYRCGGNSILAIRFCHEVAKVTNYPITVKTLTSCPTVALLCQHLITTEHVEVDRQKIEALKLEQTPLSFQQSRLWFVDKLDEGQTHYLSPMMFKLSQQCNIDSFVTSLQQIVSRHKVLSSIMHQDSEGKAWLLYVNDPLDVQQLYVTEEEYQILVKQELATPIDLTVSIPIKARIFHYTDATGEVCSDCLLIIHHIAFDGWSQNIFIHELIKFYQQCENSSIQEVQFDELAIQYGDYAVWQQTQQPYLKEQKNFWHKHLDGYEQLDLPIDFARPNHFDIRGDNFEFTLPISLTESLNKIAVKQGITLYSVMLAGFSIVLSRYSAQDDIVIGMPLANRENAQLENIIGFFVNTLPIRLKVKPDYCVNEWIKYVFQTTQDVLAHQEFPFDQLVDALHSTRDFSRHPIFQVMFALVQDDRDILPDWMQLVDLSAYENTAKYDLNLTLYQSETTKCVINYATSLFRRESIINIAKYYTTILSLIVEHYEDPIQTLSLIDYDTYKAKDLKPQYQYKRALHDDFVRNAQQFPDHIAIIDSLGEMTYSELYKAALLLSNQLRTQNHIQGAAIGVLLPKGRSQPIALLAILMSGKAFLPMDISWPKERRMQVMRQANINTLLCYEEDNYDDNICTYILDENGKAKNLSIPTVLKYEISASYSDLAYIIYTSGSTGKPKGVAIEHQGVTNTIESCKRKFNLNINDRYLALSALSFDLSIYDIFAPLSSGGTIVMPHENERYSPEHWYQLMLKHNVSMWLSAPAMMELLMNYMEQSTCFMSLPKLRIVMVGGDWISIKLPERIKDKAPICQVYSAGGATEASIFSILYHIPDEPIQTPTIPYGKALTHQTCFILDNQLNPVPVGVRGEIYIGGVGLAREYWNDSNKTEESFIFVQKLNQRLYRTGDLGRWLPDGNIEFMGRRDFQIKLNGYRIELGEIEHILLEYPEVDNVCAGVVELPQKTLVSWYVSGEPIANEVLEDFVSRHLPHYMLPTYYIWLPELPLNENGKIDRKRLPLPILSQEDNSSPKNDFETRCVAIWQALLKRDDVGVNSNFFALGGNSLLAIQACYQINQLLNTQFTLTDLAECAGIRALNQRNESKGATQQFTLIDGSGALQHPMSSMQRQLWFIEQLNMSSELYHVPILLSVDNECDWNLIRKSIEMVITRHQTLNSIFIQDEHGEYVSSQANVSIKIDEKYLSTEDWLQTLPNLLNSSFDLTQDIPVRAGIYHCVDNNQIQRSYVLFVFHHISFDGTSIPVLLDDIIEHYESLKTDYYACIPSLQIQYGDYARWQQQELNSENVVRIENWWKQTLNEWEPLVLPLDFVRPTQFNPQGENYSFTIPSPLVDKVKEVAREEGITPYAIYFSCFKLLLSLFSGQQDIIVGTPIAHRPTPSLQKLIGFFVNTLPIRSKIDDEMTVKQFRSQLFNQIIQTQQNQLPFEQLVEKTGVPHDLSINPLFQVLFLYESSLNECLPSWLNIEQIPYEYKMAKFDLTLNIFEEVRKTSVIFNYAVSLFKPETISKLVDYYLLILQQCLDADNKIGDITLISEEQTLYVREQYKKQAKCYPYDRVIWRDFVYNAKQKPQAIAVIDKLGEMTYGELYQAALQLAGQLSQSNAISGDTIGILVNKGRAQIIAVLACSFVGKAYLPMDGAWPEERCVDVLSQGNAQWVISSKKWANSLDIPISVISEEGVVDDLPLASNFTHPIEVSPNDSAYVIFTSGSTGKPKGVSVRHSGAVNSIVDTLKKMNINSDTRVFAISALSFDISVFDLFGTLSAGGSIVIPAEDERYDPNIWVKLINHHKVNFINAAPSVIALLVEGFEIANVYKKSPLEKVILVGEVIPKSLPKRIRQFSPECQVVSMGGATESSIWSIYYDIPFNELDSPSVPYGKAMTHQRFYILDKKLRLLPCGIPGEQYIGGAGVAQGYFNNKELTDERFIWHETLGERLYRTGDMGRWLPDGNMEFLGRIDFQVKVNGYRVELSEVENCALNCNNVTACCAVVHDDGLLQQLVLYYVTNGELEQSTLLTKMSQSLPLYMLPSQLIAIDALPYNSSGKLDRAALPKPEGIRQANYKAPENQQQKQLCQLWETILGIKEIGINDDFFQLGGTSLKAISLCKKMSDVIGKTITVVSLFQYRTIEKLLLASHRSIFWELNKCVGDAIELWMIHPALAGAEVFSDFATEVQGQIHCFGLDNYNLYNEVPIDNLSLLASVYCQEIEKSRAYRQGQQIHILGWSLGGLIALEIAAQLENKGVNNISLWLLDSFYQLTVQKSLSRTELLSAIGITGEGAFRATNIEAVEDKLASSSISSRLVSTKVTLFKALRGHPNIEGDITLPLISCPDNGISKVCSEFRIVELDCNHYNILDKRKIITQYIQEDEKVNISK